MSAFATIDDAVLRTRLDHLPPLPVAAMEILDGFDDPEVDVATLARHVANDQVLAARALRIANSPFYGLAGRVTGIHDAIVILGFRAVRSLVLSAAMVNSVTRIGADLGKVRVFWRHSVAAALAARGLARYTRENPEAAFTAGLLHDMGHIVLEACFPEACQEVRRWSEDHDGVALDGERTLLGLDHAHVGGMLARHWRLPETIADAIARHHTPEDGLPRPLTDLCHCADGVARALELDGQSRQRLAPMNEGAWQRLAPDWDALPALLREVERDHEETCHAIFP